MGVDYSPDPAIVGLEWQLSDSTSWAGQSLGKAIAQRFRLSSPSIGSNDPTLAFWVYASGAPGGGVYSVEVTESLERAAYPEPVEVLPNATSDSVGFSVVGAPTVHQALDDPIGLPDEDASYVTIVPGTGGESRFICSANPAELAITDGERILAVEIEARMISDAVGARARMALLLNDVEYNGPGATVSIDDWTTYKTRWAYNPRGPSSWPDNDIPQLEFGVRAQPGVRVTQLIARIFYGPDTRIGAFASSFTFEPGWNEIPYPAELDDAQDYYLVIAPIVTDGANYATFPVLRPAPDATHEASELAISADNSIPAGADTDLGGTLGFVVAKRDTAEGQVYHSVAVTTGDSASNAVSSGTEVSQTLLGESLTVDAALVRAVAPGGRPSADLTIRLESGPASAPVIEATGTLSAGVVGTRVGTYSVALDTPVALTPASPYRIVASSATSPSGPYRIARARTDQIVIPASLIGSPAYENAFNWTAVGDAQREFCVDDPPGFPDDFTTYIVDDVTSQQAAMICLENALNDTTGREIASLDVIWRAGSGIENRFTGWMDVNGTIYESRNVEDAEPDWARVPTAWRTFRVRWPTNPATGLAWTPAQVIDFDGNGNSSWGVRNYGAAGTLITQMYLQVRFADDDLAEPLTFGGLSAYTDSDPYADYVLAAGERPDPPEGFAASWDRDTYTVGLSWSSIGSLSYLLRRDCAGDVRDVDGTPGAGTFTDYTSPIDAAVTYYLHAVTPAGFESEPATAVVTTSGPVDAIGTNAGQTLVQCVVVSWPTRLDSGRDELITPSLVAATHTATQSPVIRADSGEVVIEFWQDVTGTGDDRAQFWAFDELRRQYGRLWLRMRNDRYCAPVIFSEVAREIDTQGRIRAKCKISGLERWPC